MNVFNVAVKGSQVDAQTRCAHYHQPIDIIALKFKCCGDWFPCYECHAELTDHTAQVWSKDEFNERAILCGKCGYRLTINEYMRCAAVCPQCASAFNPNCAKHYGLYFEI